MGRYDGHPVALGRKRQQAESSMNSDENACHCCRRIIRGNPLVRSYLRWVEVGQTLRVTAVRAGSLLLRHFRGQESQRC
jgi:hypothetical protein